MYGIELPGVASNFDFVRKHDALRILHNFFYILSICIIHEYRCNKNQILFIILKRRLG